MKRFVYKLSFVPKIPIPHVLIDNMLNYDGSFYLISETSLILTDFSISDSDEFKGSSVHASHAFEVFLNSEEMELISLTHAHFSQFLALNINSSFYSDYKLYLIPVMKIQGQSEWGSTIEWVKKFTEPPLVSNIYQEVLIRYDRKNQGEKLGSFFSEHGGWVNRFVTFIISLEEPVKKFIETNPIKNYKEITKPELVALFCSLKLQELLVDRITKKERSRRNQYSIIRSVAFNTNLSALTESKHNLMKCLECDDPSICKQNIPLLDVININRSSLNDYLTYSSLSSYPTAVSQGHQRIIEVLENRDFIQQICQRIPEDYNPPEPISLHPMDLSYLSPIAPIHLSIAPLFNRISDQFYPISKNQSSMMSATNKAYELIRNNLLYRFKDLRLLRIALTDSTIAGPSKKSLPSNSRLALLGNSVVNFISTDVIFLANTNESALRMAKMRSLILGGEFFRNVVDKMSLSRCFFSNHGGSSGKLSNNHAKKLIYAIFGAIFLDSNLSNCFTAFKYLVLIDNKSISEDMFNINPLGAKTLDFLTKVNFSTQNDVSTGSTVSGSNASQGTNLSNLTGSSSNPQLNATGSGSLSVGSSVSASSASVMSSLMNEFAENRDHPIKYQNVYDATKISFPSNYLPLFQAAFTHSSYSKSYTSNERLSFLGEAFSKMILSMLAYRCFPVSDTDQLEYIIYEKLKQFGLISYEKNISPLTVVQPGFEDKLAEPFINDENESEILSSLHTETLYAVIAAIALTCGFNSAYQFIHQDILGLQWYTDVRIDNIKQKELEEKIKNKTGTTPLYYQYLVDGNYYTFMSVGSFRIQCVGVAKDQIVSKQDLINTVYAAFESDDSIVLTQKEYEELEMREPSKDFPQLQYNIFD